MFKIEGYCDDKYVVSIMKAAPSLHIMEFKVIPVVNAQAKNGKLVAKTNGDVLEMLADYIKQHKLTTITPFQVRAFASSIGRSPGSYSSFLKKAIGAKMLKLKPGTTHKNTTYMVLK